MLSQSGRSPITFSLTRLGLYGDHHWHVNLRSSDCILLCSRDQALGVLVLPVDDDSVKTWADQVQECDFRGEDGRNTEYCI